jgi:UDP-N-acetylmuramoyl-tripeptide--D-alanyl-D-alanine ligase
MASFIAAEIEIGTGGILIKGSKDEVFSNVSIDTRNLCGGEVFFAIRGPNQDGHKFIPDALAKGAACIVAEQSYEHPGVFPEGRVLIKVNETHQALKSLALYARRRWHGTLAAVTGSMGKTTTRAFAAQLMKSAFSVYQTPGNYNNLFGLPLALFGLSPEHEFGIFEMGMSALGEIAEMCRIAEPSIGIITNVAPAHLEFFSSIEEIARAKGELAEALPPNGALIYNGDDPLVQNIAARFNGTKISFGIGDEARLRADRIEITGLHETSFRILCDGAAMLAKIPIAGAHYVMNALAAAALAHMHDIAWPVIIEHIAKLEQATMRGQILQFKEGMTVIDDSYNSNPQALMRMMDVIAGIPNFSRRIVIAGEMKELGSSAESLHYECGAFAANCGLDMVIGIQGAAKEIARAFQDFKPDAQACFFDRAENALDFVDRELRGGDLVLVKGSRSVWMEKIVKHLRETRSVLTADER